MSDYALEVYRTMQVFNGAIENAVHAGYEVRIDYEILSTYDLRNITTVRVDVLRPIPPEDPVTVAISEPA